MLTEEQKKKYEQDARVYHLSNCYRTGVRLENAFLAGAEHAHPIAHSEGYNEALDAFILMIPKIQYQQNHDYFVDEIQKLRK